MKEIYLDGAATALPLPSVLEAAQDVAKNAWGSAYRGMYKRSEQITQDYEDARGDIAGYMCASEPEEIVFTGGTTDGMNKLCQAIAPTLQKTDRVLIGIAEHSSVMLPWRKAAERYGFAIDYLPVNEEGHYTPGGLMECLTKDTKVLCVAEVGNVLSAVNDIAELYRIAKLNGTLVILDMAQAAPHGFYSVWDACDFAALSGHKMYAPFGAGILYGRKDLLEKYASPDSGGGSAVRARKAAYTDAELPRVWEPGTPNVVGAVALAEAFAVLDSRPADLIVKEAGLIKQMYEGLAAIPGIRALGPTNPSFRVAVCAFRMAGVHPHDAGQMYADKGICVRTGYHCAEMLHEYLGIGPTIRASICFQNTPEEIDTFLNATEDILHTLRVR